MARQRPSEDSQSSPRSAPGTPFRTLIDCGTGLGGRSKIGRVADHRPAHFRHTLEAGRGIQGDQRAPKRKQLSCGEETH